MTLAHRMKIGPLASPPHFDIVSTDCAALRRVAFRTAALQKNLAQPQPICRSWRLIELFDDEQEEILAPIPGADLFLTYMLLRESQTMLLRCYDTRSGSMLIEVTCPRMMPSWSHRLFYPSVADAGTYIFAYITYVSDSPRAQSRSKVKQVGIGPHHLTSGLQ